MKINSTFNVPSFKSIYKYKLSPKQDILLTEAQNDPVISTMTKGFGEHNVDFDFVGEDKFVSARITNPTTDNPEPLGKIRAKINTLHDAKMLIARTYAAAVGYMMDHDDNVGAGSWVPMSF